MAVLSKIWFLRHLRSEATNFVLHQSGGKTVQAGRGLSFWFVPWTAAIEASILLNWDLRAYPDAAACIVRPIAIAIAVAGRGGAFGRSRRPQGHRT